MSHRLKLLLALLTVVLDAVLATVAFYLAYQLRALLPFPTPIKMAPFRDYLRWLVLHVSSLLTTFFFYRLYHTRRGGSRIDLFYSIVSAVSIATVIGTSLSYLAYQTDGDLSRGVTVYAWALTIALLFFGRIFLGWIRGRVAARRPDRLLLVGTGDVARMILQKTLHSPQLGYRVVGFVDGEDTEGDVVGVPILGSQSELARILRENDIQEVVIALPNASHDELLDMISACEAEHANVRIFPDFFQIVASELSIGDLDGLPMLTIRDPGLRGWKLTLKRTIDLVIGSLALILLSPLMLLVALLIRLGSKGPVFYAQVRVGLDGKPFPILKFRTMLTGAEEGTGPVWTTIDDPRRTRLGEFLRKTSIDELPQLINVLVGDMSLVGPRPERPIFVEQFKQVVPRYMERHKEKAGMTGWAQVNGLRGDTSIVERTKYDLYYIENWSPMFDLKIILRTMVNQLRGERHAY
ncbi:MAG: undecaprenyl-phosphate glucose phosphotransferase [Anaerolineales bacterium]|nr:MAG: undecaprenyl-phosphate glucose phosphotransferase [Anaerolineales bacterium]